jgi:hypothetical protein
MENKRSDMMREDDGLVVLVVPLKDVVDLIQALQTRGRNSVTPPPTPPVVIKMNNRPFGKLPPGAYPHWQSREWIGFSLWLVVVVALLAGAVWRNLPLLRSVTSF